MATLIKNKSNKETKEYNFTEKTSKGEATITAYSLEDGFFTYYVEINNEIVYQDVSECWRLKDLNQIIDELGLNWVINQKK